MRFSTHQPPLYCGIDVHARSMHVCLLRHDGASGLHRPMQAAPAPFLTAVAPSRAGLVVAVAGLCTGYGLADLGAEQGIPFVLGPALSMQAMHGGQATKDPSASEQMALVLRGGLLPQASVSRAAMRATRARLRRQTPRMRTRAELFSPVPNTNHQYHWPAIGKHIASTATRAGGAERLHAEAVHKTIAVDLALLTA